MIKIVISAFAIIMIISSCESDNPESKRWVTISGRDMTLDNPVQKIICDDSDNIWFASYGVSRFDGKFWHTYGEKDGFTNISIKDMDIDRTGNVFFGNEFEGLKKYNGEEFLNLDITKEAKSLAIDSIGGIWYGYYDFVYYYNGIRTAKFEFSVGAVENDINSIFVDSKGMVWVGTNLKGIYSYNGKEWEQQILPENVSSFIFDITEDKAGNLWAVSYLSGIIKFEGGRWNEIKDIAATQPYGFKVISADLDNKIWVGTIDGLFMYDGKSWKKFTNADGFNSNSVFAIAVDHENNVWVATTSGVSKYLQN